MCRLAPNATVSLSNCSDGVTVIMVNTIVAHALMHMLIVFFVHKLCTTVFNLIWG